MYFPNQSLFSAILHPAIKYHSIDVFNAETNRLKIITEKEEPPEQALPRPGYKLQIDEETGNVREVKSG